MNIDVNGVNITLTEEQLEQVSRQQKKARPAIERIFNMQHVYEELNTTEEDEIPYKYPKTKKQRALNAAARRECISRALNGDWKEDWTNESQYKYYIWWERTSSGWSFDGISGYDWNTGLGFGAFYKDEKTAQHAAKYFKDILIEELPE